MPERILELLENGSLTEGQIAEKLQISLEELKAGMDYLKQMGFIKATFINPSSGGCSGNCGSCGSSCNNSSHSTATCTNTSLNTSCQVISPSAYTVWEVI